MIGNVSAFLLQSVEYIPYYGGAKGQYLELKKDNNGIVFSERIVSEDVRVSNDNVPKKRDENILSKVLAANLKSLQTLSGSLIKLHTLGRNTGRLNNSDKTRFEIQLASLAETASNTIKLIEEIGDDVNTLFKKGASRQQHASDVFDEVEEEDQTVTIENPTGDTDITDSGIIAEAKPFGLAVVGESGLASSRPQATAVSLSGIAVARPVATAIAGIDPTLLGINFQMTKAKQ